MVARVRISTTVGPDGSIRLLERDVSAVGILAGDHVQVEVVKNVARVDAAIPAEEAAARERILAAARELSALPFDEWAARFRADFPVPDDVDVEELNKQGQELAADEFWAKYERNT